MKLKYKILLSSEFSDDIVLCTASECHLFAITDEQSPCGNKDEFTSLFTNVLMQINVESLFDAKRGKQDAYYNIELYIDDIPIYELALLGNRKNIVFKEGNQLLLFERQSNEISELLVFYILEQWCSDNQSLSWKNFSKNIEMLTAWQTACLYFSDYEKKLGLFQKRVATNIEVKLSPEEFISYEEFFCYLGEAFLGYKGYIGRSINVFFELLDELIDKYEIRSISITIYDQNSFQKRLAEIGFVDKDFITPLSLNSNCILKFV